MTNSKIYRYYSTQRPVDIGTFPKPPKNKVVNINNYDRRLYIKDIEREAWGYVEYEKPLSEDDAYNYELKGAKI